MGINQITFSREKDELYTGGHIDAIVIHLYYLNGEWV